MGDVRFDRDSWFDPNGKAKRKNIGPYWSAPTFDKPVDGVRVCIFSTYNKEYDPIAEIAELNWAEYAFRNRYCLRTYPGVFHLDSSRPATYGDKAKHALYYDLRGNFDIVMWLDIDSLFIDMDIRVEDVLRDAHYKSGFDAGLVSRLCNPDRRFLWTHGDGGPQSGLLIARTDDETEKHLRYAYEYAARENNVRNGKIEPNGISDQDAMTRLMHVPPFFHTFKNCVRMETIGLHYPDTPKPNPWIVTCRGGSIEDKLAAMQDWSKRGKSVVSSKAAHHA